MTAQIVSTINISKLISRKSKVNQVRLPSHKVIEPFDIREDTFQGNHGYWQKVYFPPYFKQLEDGERAFENGDPIPRQLIKFEPEPIEVFFKTRKHYPGVFFIQPKNCNLFVKDSENRIIEVSLKPQLY